MLLWPVPYPSPRRLLEPLWRAVADFFEPIWRPLMDFLAPAGRVLLGYSKTIVQTTVFTSIIGVAALSFIVASLYWLYLVACKRRFITIAPFRVWSNQAPSALGEGLAARLGDEIARLQREVKECGKADDPKLRAREALFHNNVFEPPAPAQVTVQYAGISPEALTSYLRRKFKRQELITGDLLPQGNTLLLVARALSARAGPWEVSVPNAYSLQLREALQELAVRALIDLQPDIRQAIANALAVRQLKAHDERRQKEELTHARLALIAIGDHPIAHHNLGTALVHAGRPDEAIDAYTRALDREGEDATEVYVQALYNRGTVKAQRGEYLGAQQDFEKAGAQAPDDPKIHRRLGLVLQATGRQEAAEAAFARAKSLEEQGS
ncbi:MAG TPA: tetratricopeptide repeat protein [Thermoanaerobaculia bacterium]|nr:tetratricopeptide repeat protein [Thermoanaerobaculia bacterium]